MAGPRLATPQIVEVVPAESVDPAVSDVAAELAKLEQELHDLDAEVAQLERQVEEARRRTRGGDAAVPILEKVFLDQAASARAGLTAALEGAVKGAESRLASARAEAEALVAGMPSPRFEADPSHQRAGAPYPPAGEHEDAPAWSDTARPSFSGPTGRQGDAEWQPPAGSAAQRGNGQAMEPPRPSEPVEEEPAPNIDEAADSYDPPDAIAFSTNVASDPERAPEPAEGVLEQEPEPTGIRGAHPQEPFDYTTSTTAILQTPLELGLAPPPAAKDDPGAFGQFWGKDDTTLAVPDARSGILLDAILPLVAVGIIVLVLLSWIG